MKVFYTNGWFAEYDGDGNWVLIDTQGNLVSVGSRVCLENRFSLERIPR